jgi:hypothetical protein
MPPPAFYDGTIKGNDWRLCMGGKKWIEPPGDVVEAPLQSRLLKPQDTTLKRGWPSIKADSTSKTFLPKRRSSMVVCARPRRAGLSHCLKLMKSEPDDRTFAKCLSNPARKASLESRPILKKHEESKTFI